MYISLKQRHWAISSAAGSVLATMVLIFLFTHRVYKILIVSLNSIANLRELC